MSWTIRCLPHEGIRRATSRRTSRWQILVGTLLCIAWLATIFSARSARAEDETQSIAQVGLFLQTGSTGAAQGAFTGSYDLNAVVGAQRFYNAGLTGAGAVMANIEAGHVWNGHETMSHVGLIPTSGGALGEFDRHATAVAMVMGGRPTSSGPQSQHQRGIAPGAQLFSGAIATGWAGTRYTGGFFLGFSDISTLGPYRAAFINGLATSGGPRTADVINSSYVYDLGAQTRTGNDNLTGTLDALMNENPRTLLTIAAGNTLPSGAGPNRVLSSASGYNVMAVASLAPNGGPFNIASDFSNGGPNDYNDPFGTVSAVRQVIDIAAPGENFGTAYYGGQTGGNGPTLPGSANGPAGGPDWYLRSVAGTSVAAPTVAGGAALLYDAAHTRLTSIPDARDARVMKAVLMNSADKTLGWDNGQIVQPNGGVITTRGLDDRVGAGRMNLDRAFEQLLYGTKDVAGTLQGNLGFVDRRGWDFGLVAQGTDNDYLIVPILPAGSKFNATLDWFRDRSTQGTTSFFDDSFDNLDLQLWEAIGGVATNLIAESKSLYNNSEHFSFNLPKTAQYLLRVRWTSERFDLVGDVNSEHYGLAWFAIVPEPGSALLAGSAVFAMLITMRRRHAE